MVFFFVKNLFLNIISQDIFIKQNMKKSIFLIICFFSIFSTTNALFWSPNSTDLYKNIDTWLYKLENKMLEFELKWWERKTWILKEVNQLAEYNEIPRCLDESNEISTSNFIKITKDENVSELTKYFSESCYNIKDKKYLTDITTSYMYLFKKYLDENKNIAEEKSKKINQVSSIWLYSDWILENSWFDLITDIEEIDKIIFSEVTQYKWGQNDDITDFLNSLVDSAYNQNLTSNDDYSEDNYYYVDDSTENDSEYNNNNTGNYNISETKTNSNYICLNNEENSWLNNQSIISLLKSINGQQNNNNSTPQNWNSADSPKSTGWYLDDIVTENPKSDYSKVTDNSQWPCETFFCINIEFIMYNHNLFWWGEEGMSIEYLIKRSNEHLSKFAWTSLIPAKMSTNQFELWLENLDLPSIFHLWIQISTKPIPILNIEKEWKEDETEYASKNLLERYYKENWLDYKRRNSLVLFQSIEQDKQNVNNSIWLSNERIISNNNKYWIYKYENNNSTALNKIIEKKVSYWITQNFETQFTELYKFTIWINYYIENLRSIITEMEKIPIDSA